MLHLLLASLIWAFSFGLIKGALTGYDPRAVAFVRLALAALLFAPWVLRSRTRAGTRNLRFAALGALQFGLMYVLYIASFAYLPAYAVALFTVFTPLYVTLLADAAARRVDVRHLAAAVLAVAGAALVVRRVLPADEAWPGILLLQGANLCFAAGQLVYRHWRLASPEATADETANMAWMYLGAALLAGAAAASGGALSDLTVFDGRAWRVLLYLGLLPTGAAFYLWNRGAARVGSGTLATSNNLKIPLAVLASWLVFGEQVAPLPVAAGLIAVLAAVALAGGGHSN